MTEPRDIISFLLDPLGLFTVKREEVTQREKKVGAACIPCVPPTTLIWANPGIKEISDINVGDRVLDATGSYTNVKETMARNYNGKLIAISVPYQNFPIMLTPEHPVLAVKLHQCVNHGYCFPGKDNPRCKLCKKKWEYEPELVPAHNLTAQGVRCHFLKHAVLLPRLKSTKDVESINTANIANVAYTSLNTGWIIPKKRDAHNGSRSTIAVRDSVAVDKRLLKLAGFYLAEGYVKQVTRGAHLFFSFGQRENNYAQAVNDLLYEVFGIEAHIKVIPTGLLVFSGSGIIANFFVNLFGTGAKEKHIPQWILELPPKKQIALMEGYWRGDGYIREEGNSTNLIATTVSRKLAYSLRIMLHRLGIIHNLSQRNGTRGGFINGREIINSGPVYELSIGGPSAIKLGKLMGYEVSPWRFLQSHLAGIDDNWIYLPIKKVECREYQGSVMNLSTESQTYVAGGIVIHNCSRDHLLTVKASLIEAARMAKSRPMSDSEIQERIAKAEEELDVWERYDMSPAQLASLPAEQANIVRKALARARSEIRHQFEVTGIRWGGGSISDLEAVAASAEDIDKEFRKAIAPYILEKLKMPKEKSANE